MDAWLKILVPILLTAILTGVISLYQRVSDLEKYTMGRALLEYRLNHLEQVDEMLCERRKKGD